MKIAFTTSGDSLDSPLDSRFGRAPRLLVLDLDTDAADLIDNSENADAAQGAGRRTAETLARTGAAGLVTGHCGPKAFEVLTAAGIAVYTTDAPTVAEALTRFRQGALKPLPVGNP